jgi:hypothetical protein
MLLIKSIMGLFKSKGYAQGKYNPGGGRKKNSSYNSKRKKGRSSSRKTTTKTSKSSYSVVNKVLDNQLHVYRYPFSTRTKYPKIPDGKVDLTIGLPFNYSRQIQFSLDAVKAFVYLYPGITDCVSVFEERNDVVYHVSNGHFIQHCLPYVEGTDVNNDKSLNYELTGYGKYRYVSAGLRIGIDSTWLNNGGIWKAWRIPIGMVCERFHLNLEPHTERFHHLKPIGIHTLGDNQISNSTFQTGGLKSLGMYEFRLQDNVDEHDFINIPTRVEYKSDEVTLSGRDVQNDGKSSTRVFDYIADHQFDMIQIEIDLTIGKAESVSFHSSANVELVPNEHGNYWHFATQGVSNKSKLSSTKRAVEKYNRLPGTISNYSLS